MNPMQIVDIKSPPRICDRKRSARVLRVVRSAYKVPPAAIYRPESKWSVVIAFILSVALHIGALAIVEMQARRPSVEFAQNHDNSDRAKALD
jgi:hypothetical protein